MTATIARLSRLVQPFYPHDIMSAVADRFVKDSEITDFLSIPIVNEHQQVLGQITRYQMNQIFLGRFSHALFERTPLSDFIDKKMLVMHEGADLISAAEYVISNLTNPLSADFAIVNAQNQLTGVGRVIELLQYMTLSLTESKTELTGALVQLKQSQVHLIQNEKISALGKMVAGFAHEINTPLAYVKNNFYMLSEHLDSVKNLIEQCNDNIKVISASYDNGPQPQLQQKTKDAIANLRGILETDAPPTDDLKQIIEDSFHGIEQMSSLVTGLKGFSRLDAASTDNVSLNECISQTLLISRANRKATTRIVQKLTDIPLVRCSPQQINQVLLNLIQNADSAVGDAGIILLKTWEDAQYVHLSVQDNGDGIPEKVQNKIFDPFFTTKPVGEGTGLGLSISQQIMQQHGGEINFVTKQGIGTRFVISLPKVSGLQGLANVE